MAAAAPAGSGASAVAGGARAATNRDLSIELGEAASAVLVAREGSSERGSSSAGQEYRKAKCEAAISIELVEYDAAVRDNYERRQAKLFGSRQASAASEDGSAVAVPLAPQMLRLLPVAGSVCISRMEIAQRSINFGECEAYDTPAEKSILLYNRSAVPLFYKVAAERPGWLPPHVCPRCPPLLIAFDPLPL